MSRRWLVLGLLLAAVTHGPAAAAAPPREVILDVDIGDDYDDAVALALVLASPEFKLDAVITSLGDTQLRARMVERLLRQLGRTDIAVAAGPATAPGTRFTQSRWAAGGAPSGPFPDAVATTLARLRAAPPGRLTLIALAPATTLGAMLARDPVAFRRLAEIVVMGGSVQRGYGARAGTNSASPSIEYNVRCDPAGFRALLGSGVPVRMMPLDATEIVLDASSRRRLFDAGTPLADWLATLYPSWADNNPWGRDPVLFDVVPVAWLLDPAICRQHPLDIAVSAAGATVPVAGPPNAEACLEVDRAAVSALLQARLAAAR